MLYRKLLTPLRVARGLSCKGLETMGCVNGSNVNRMVRRLIARTRAIVTLLVMVVIIMSLIAIAIVLLAMPLVAIAIVLLAMSLLVLGLPLGSIFIFIDT